METKLSTTMTSHKLLKTQVLDGLDREEDMNQYIRELYAKQHKSLRSDHVQSEKVNQQTSQVRYNIKISNHYM